MCIVSILFQSCTGKISWWQIISSIHPSNTHFSLGSESWGSAAASPCCQKNHHGISFTFVQNEETLPLCGRFVKVQKSCVWIWGLQPGLFFSGDLKHIVLAFALSVHCGGGSCRGSCSFWVLYCSYFKATAAGQMWTRLGGGVSSSRTRLN